MHRETDVSYYCIRYAIKRHYFSDSHMTPNPAIKYINNRWYAAIGAVGEPPLKTK
jgi:hypothetical protein